MNIGTEGASKDEAGNEARTQQLRTTRPEKQGLYDPAYEHDACGVGFVVDVKGRKSHKILQQGLQVLTNLDHRGACGAETNTGDGAGVLLQMPHKFLVAAAAKSRITLPEPEHYGCGIVFLPRNPTLRRRIEEVFEKIVQSEGQTVLGWRTVPTNNSSLGDTAKSCEPYMRQVFIARNPNLSDALAFERKLYVIRKRAYSEIRRDLEQTTGRTNGRFADTDWTPIRYLNRNFPHDVLMGFMRSAQVGIVTPVRDGMNLVAKEFVAAQDPADPGVLILSTLAGAARELTGAIMVNPYDSRGMAHAIQQAFNMPISERRERHQAMNDVLRRNSITAWHTSFVETLESVTEPAANFKLRFG